MDKKDIYEHLAKIYLDASQKKKKKHRRHPDLKRIFAYGAVFLLVAGAVSFISLNKQKHAISSEFALLLHADIAKINFNFDPAKKETFTINLKKLNASRYRNLGFTVKKANYANKISLRIEFTNIFKEKSEIYVRDIPDNWQEYKISLKDFNRITDWSQMQNLCFIVEQWNTQKDNGVVYIENIALLR